MQQAFDDEDVTERVKLNNSNDRGQRKALIKAGGLDMNAHRFAMAEVNNRVQEETLALTKAGGRWRWASICRMLLLLILYTGLLVCAAFAVWASMVLESPGEPARRGCLVLAACRRS